MMAKMNLLSASPGNGYAAETLMFAITVVLLALPPALLFAASFLQGRMRERAGTLRFGRRFDADAARF
jgi:hypothetical protein